MAVPSSVTDSYDALLTTTLRGYIDTELHDDISRGNKLIGYLDMKGRWTRHAGGHQLAVPLMYGLNTTADIYSGYGVLDTTPQDGMTTAFYDWCQLSVSISISRKEERQNAGKAKILSLLEAKTKQAKNSIVELLNNCIVAGRITASANLGRFLQRVGRLDSGALGPLPLGALIDANASRSVSIGNINGNTYAFWRNNSDSSTATTYALLKKELNNTYNDCTKGIAGNPDLMLGDQVAWELYWNSLQVQERYIITDKRVVDVLGGTDALKFRGAAFIWDEVVPDVETNAEVVDAIGTMTASNVWFINTDTLEFISDTETDFINTAFVRPENQDARSAQILWMGATAVNNRRKNGVLYGIDRAIAA